MRTLSSVAALALAIGLTVPASAEAPTPWPRDVDITVRHGSEYVPPKARTVAKPVNAWTDPFAPYEAWKAIPSAPDAHTFSYGVTSKQLDAQQSEYRKYWRARNSELFNSDGGWADVLPVRAAEKRAHDSLGTYKPPFGAPVMSGDN